MFATVSYISPEAVRFASEMGEPPSWGAYRVGGPTLVSMAKKRPLPDGKGAVKRMQTNVCELCGWDKFTQRHRIIPGKEGGKYRLDNVAYLCPNCHHLADNGMVSRETLFEILAKRLADRKKDDS